MLPCAQTLSALEDRSDALSASVAGASQRRRGAERLVAQAEAELAAFRASWASQLEAARRHIEQNEAARRERRERLAGRRQIKLEAEGLGEAALNAELQATVRHAAAVASRDGRHRPFCG